MTHDVKIRDLSTEVYARLQESARENGRSMEAELRMIVGASVGSRKSSMPSLVIELQEQALDPKMSTTDLLRKVKAVASKLGVDDILEWVTHELGGYPDETLIPDYRELRGVAKAFNPMRGWLKIIFEDPELEEQVCAQKTRQPISELEQNAKYTDGALTFSASSALAKGLENGTDARLFVARAQVVGVLDAVRNRVLDWALALEKQGVLGNGMSFSADEKAGAVNSDFHFSPSYTVHGNVGVLGDVSDSTVTQYFGSPMEPLAKALGALSDIAARLDEPAGVVVAATAERAAVAAASMQPNVALVERLIGGISSVVQGIAALGPAWSAVATEAVKLGFNIGLPGS